MSPTWKEVWETRRLESSFGSILEQLMAADGADAFAHLSEAAWSSFVLGMAERMELGPGDSVYEVGCGAGAFLYVLHQHGYRVGGLDASSTLIDYARAIMPEGRFVTGDAAELDPDDAADAVVSCGVFHYFSSLEYAQRVLERMAQKARRAVAVLDVPDQRKEAAALAARQEEGGREAYERRYAGLSHLYFDRAWFADLLPRLGFPRVVTEDQDIQGYRHGAYRFNVVALR